MNLKISDIFQLRFCLSPIAAGVSPRNCATTPNAFFLEVLGQVHFLLDSHIGILQLCFVSLLQLLDPLRQLKHLTLQSGNHLILAGNKTLQRWECRAISIIITIVSIIASIYLNILLAEIQILLSQRVLVTSAIQTFYYKGKERMCVCVCVCVCACACVCVCVRVCLGGGGSS